MHLCLSSEMTGDKSLSNLKSEDRDAFQISVCVKTCRLCVLSETIA